MAENHISRRGFLKATGALGAAATALQLPDLNWLERAEGKVELSGETKVIRSMCRMCHGTCGTLIHVRDGRVVKVEGNPEAPTNKGTLCPKGLATTQHQYNPRRLRYPMKRVGNRGEGKWQRITWDEAYQILSDKLYDTWETYGKQAVAHCGGTGRMWRDFSNAVIRGMGIGVAIGMPPLCYLPRIEVITKMFGYRIPVADYFGFQGATPGVVVFWGNNVTYSHADGMHGSRPANAVNEGAKLIVIDPVYTNVAQKADIWLPVRPASDTALAMGFLNVIINEDLVDHEFIEQWTNLPGLVREDNGRMLTEYDLSGEEPEPFDGPPFLPRPPEHLVFWDSETNAPVVVTGPDVKPAMEGPFEVELADGTTVTCRTAWQHLVDRVNEYPLDKVAETTWCKEEDIAEAARMMATIPGLALQWGVSFDQWGVNSSRGVQAAMMIVALTGNLDAPGGMAMWNVPAFRKGSFPGETVPYVSPELDRMDLVPPESFEVSGRYEKFPLARSHGDYSMRDLAAGNLQIEMLFVQGANPLTNSMNTKVVFEALQKVPFIAVLDLYMTSTAMISDLVLPIAMWTERDQIGDMHLLWGIQARQKAVEPIGEARSDEDAMLGLAKKLAERDPEYWNEVIPWNSVEEWLDWRLEPMNMTWEQLKEQWIYYEPQEPYGYKKHGFNLPSGKAELWLRLAHDLTGEALPFFVEPPLFSPDGQLAKEYPLLCTTRRVPGFFHSEFRQLPWMRELWPEPRLEINPRKAAELGIEDGDWVYVETAMGRIKQKATFTEGIDPRVVCSEHDWWFPEAAETAPDLGGIFESNQNVLTYNDPSQGYDPLNGTPQLRGFLVKVYKAEGPPKGLDVKTVYEWTPTEEV